MATPVINVSFTADVQCGVSPLAVQFTDTTIITNGFARAWLWDLGDGTISEDQNPSHVYTGNPGQKYTVNLAILATEGEFDALSSSTNFGPTNFIDSTKTFGSGPTNNDAWAARSIVAPTDHFFSHAVGFNGAIYSYHTNDVNIFLKSNSSSLAFVQIRARIVASITSIQGSMEIDGGGDTPTGVNVWTVVGRLAGVTTANPKSVFATIVPQVQLGDPPAGHNWGIEAEAGTRTYANTSTQLFDEYEEAAFISLATSPEADFEADPAKGRDPLPVQFTNNTIESDCGPAATWSWKKRIAGSGGPFVEFSTERDPLHTFTK